MRSLRRVLEHPQVEEPAWGEQLCVARCGRLAEALWEGRPVCLGCADDLLELIEAERLRMGQLVLSESDV